MEPLNHQQAALAEIVARARAFFAGGWLELPVVPRWPTLMVGPTGSGKTAVAAMAADALSDMLPGDSTVSLLRVSSPGWMPCGAHNRGTKETISVIAAHIAKHDRTILVADEVDKVIAGPGGTAAGSDGPWQSYIRGELYDLLDLRWPTGMKDDGDDMTATDLDALTTKLRTTVFIVGIGTFQSWFDDSNTRRSMGFGAEISTETQELSSEIIAERMPRELANRWNSSLIRIPELSAADYHRIANEVENQLPLRMRDAFRAEVQRLLPSAIAAKKGVRFLEECMMEVLKTLPREPAITAEFLEIRNQTKPVTEPCML